MFSTATVASSTRMPTASARPLSVMMLTVWPTRRSATRAEKIDSGIVSTTMSADLQLRRNASTVSAVSRAPSAPSIARLRMAVVT